MTEYLEKVLRKNIKDKHYTKAEDLPIDYKNDFEISIVSVDKQDFIIAEPVESMNLSKLRKAQKQLERYTGYACALGLENANWYSAPKMVEEGIPFIWKNHQVYLPFLGLLINENEARKIKPCSVISFLTQKLLIKALYDNWQDVSVTKASELLGVSKMSATRCFDEIESLGMKFIRTIRKSRRFFSKEKKEMWDIITPFLRNPIIRTFRLRDKPKANMLLSGTSALANYSMLSEDDYETYAVSKKQIGELGIKGFAEVQNDEEPSCVIHEVGYTVPFGDNKAIDPLSLTLVLTDFELADPRVEKCRNEMLEELVW